MVDLIPIPPEIPIPPDAPRPRGLLDARGGRVGGQRGEQRGVRADLDPLGPELRAPPRVTRAAPRAGGRAGAGRARTALCQTAVAAVMAPARKSARSSASPTGPMRVLPEA